MGKAQIAVTKKAQMEIEKLEKEIKLLTIERKRWMDRKGDWAAMNVFMKEARRVENRIYGKEDKLERIKRDGISSAERRALAKEGWDSFEIIEREKSITGVVYIKVGFSKTLNQYCRVTMTRWGSLMGNVKGCRSLENKKELDDFSFIDKSEYDAIIEKNETIVKTSFMGSSEKIVSMRRSA